MDKLIMDKEHLKMAMLKHEQTFREQVYELHRLYQIQKMLMKDAAERRQKNDPYVITCRRAEARLCLDQAGPADVYNFPGLGDDTDRVSVSEAEDEHSDLELTLGPKSYHHHKKIKASWSPNNQDRLNCPPWLFQALSMNIT